MFTALPEEKAKDFSEKLLDMENIGFFVTYLGNYKNDDFHKKDGVLVKFIIYKPNKDEEDTSVGFDLFIKGIIDNHLLVSSAWNMKQVDSVDKGEVNVYVETFDEFKTFLITVRDGLDKLNIKPSRIFNYSTYHYLLSELEKNIKEKLGCTLDDMKVFMKELVRGDVVDVALNLGYKFADEAHIKKLRDDSALLAEIITEATDENAIVFLNNRIDEVGKYVMSNECLPVEIMEMKQRFFRELEEACDNIPVKVNVSTEKDEDFSNFIGAYI